MITLHCRGGIEITGATTNTIARREFGAKAFYRDSANPNDPTIGQILCPTEFDPRQYFVCAEILAIEAI